MSLKRCSSMSLTLGSPGTELRVVDGFDFKGTDLECKIHTCFVFTLGFFEAFSVESLSVVSLFLLLAIVG